MTKRIEISATPRELIAVNLVGTEYTLTPPKGALGLTLAEKAQDASASGDVRAIWGEVLNWLTMAVGKKQAKAIQARLDDADDDLDIIHVISLMEQVVEMVTGNPTTSSSD